MVFIDFRNVDFNGNEELILNLFGDIFLLGNDEIVFENEDNLIEMIEENINTYVDILCRESVTFVEVIFSFEIDNEEAFFGYGRFLINFERVYFV